MPDYTAKLSKKSWGAFDGDVSLARAVVFSDKAEPTAMIKVRCCVSFPPAAPATCCPHHRSAVLADLLLAQGLSAKYRDRLKIAVVGKAEKEIARALNVTSYPALRVLPAGGSSETSEAVHFKGKISFFAIDLFLIDYAKPAASNAGAAGAPKEKFQDKTDKSKDDPKKSKGKPKEGAAADAKGGAKQQTPPAGGKQADAPKNQKAASGKASDKGKEQKTAKGGAAEPPVYGGDSAKKNSNDRRGSEL
jgi:hypothetical protein